MDEKNTPNPVKVNINLDTTPILYTDNVFIGVSPDGVVLDFGQKLGPTNELRIISRLGMSLEHAKKLYKTLGDQLKLAQGQGPTENKKVN